MTRQSVNRNLLQTSNHTQGLDNLHPLIISNYQVRGHFLGGWQLEEYGQLAYHKAYLHPRYLPPLDGQ